MAKRGRKPGSRNRSTIVLGQVDRVDRVERLEKEAVAETPVKTVAPLVEEKFNNFPPARSIEKERKILAAMEGIDEEDLRSLADSDIDPDDPSEELPFYLRNLPEGSDKRRHIVAAAQAAIILGASVHQVVRQYGIRKERVVQWHEALVTTEAIGKRDRLSAMIFAYIEQEMKSLLAISMITSDEEWVVRQSASDLAHFIAVKSDRLLMLLQAFARSSLSQREYEGQLKVITDTHAES